MKIGFFTDSHYSSALITCGTRYNKQSLRKIEEALRFFKAEQCDRVICLGDLIDHEKDQNLLISNLQAVSEQFHASSVPYTVLMGNHDCFSVTQDMFYSILGEQARPKPFVCEKETFLFLDACHYANGEHYSPEKAHDWRDTNFPSPATLRDELEAIPGPVYVLMHQNLDPEIPGSHRPNNDQAVRKVLEDSGKVKTVFQGHYHPGHENRVNRIEYITLPAMCEYENAFFLYQFPRI